jgi:hypothetical protein
MLGFDGGITQESRVGYHGHVFIGGHVVPSFEADFGVVDLGGKIDVSTGTSIDANFCEWTGGTPYRQCWGNDAAETIPVLRLN